LELEGGGIVEDRGWAEQCGEGVIVEIVRIGAVGEMKHPNAGVQGQPGSQAEVGSLSGGVRVEQEPHLGNGGEELEPGRGESQSEHGDSRMSELNGPEYPPGAFGDHEAVAVRGQTMPAIENLSEGEARWTLPFGRARRAGGAPGGKVESASKVSERSAVRGVQTDAYTVLKEASIAIEADLVARGRVGANAFVTEEVGARVEGKPLGEGYERSQGHGWRGRKDGRGETTSPPA